MDSSFSLHLMRGHILLLCGVVAAAGFFSYIFYRRRPSGMIGGDWPLAFLRGAGISLLLLALFEPLASMVVNLKQKPLVPILFDASGSMSVDDVLPHRLGAAQKAVESEILPDLSGRAEVVILGFSDRVEVVSESLVPDGSVTDIGGSIESVPRVLGRQPSALILVSDGNWNVGLNPIDAGAEAGFPVYVVGVGDPSVKKDVLVKGIRANEIAYTGDIVPIEVDVESKGFEGEKTPVSLYERGKLLDRKEISLSGDSKEQSVSFELNPRTPGLHTYRVAVESLEDELTEENNVRPFAMNVLKSRINVLFIGRPNWDAKFLMRALALDKNVTMEQLLLLDDASRYLLLRGEKQSRGKLPSGRSELAAYDAIVLHSPAKGQISEELGRLISDFVSSDGRGLLLMGEPSGLPQSLEPLLPVIMSGELKRQVRFEPTAAGATHPAISLADDMYESESIWKGMPPVEVDGRAIGLKAGATALAVDPDTKTAQGFMPTIAIERFGRGKTMCILTSETWKWSFMPVGLGKHGSAHSTLYSNIFRWLVARQELDRLRIRTEKNVYTSGEKVTFFAEFYDENFRPDDKADVRVRIPTTEPLELPLASMGMGRYEGTIEALPAGEFRYRASAYKGDERLAEARGELVIEDLTLEFIDTRMNEDELKSIADVSGGKYFPLRESNLLPESLVLQTPVERRRLELDLKTSPVLFLIVIGIFTTEWLWRKRRGLA